MFSIHIGLKSIYYLLSNEKKIVDSKKKVFSKNNDYSNHLLDIKETIKSIEKNDIVIDNLKLIYYDSPYLLYPPLFLIKNT